jgi:hypothetical protein
VRVNDGLLEVAGPTVGGTLTTRDRGHIDELGRVYVDGRDDGVIVSGGEKIDPLELERVLGEHPQVREACVLGVPSPRWGERPIALLVARSAPRPGSEELDSWCAQRLSRFKTPDRYLWVDTLATNGMDKRSRTTLTEVLRRLAPDLFTAVDADAPKPVRESGWEGPGLPSLEVDESVNGARGRPHHRVSADQPVADGDGLLSRSRDTHLDADTLAQTHGATEIGVGVNQRRAPLFSIEESLDAARRHGKKLFESLVAVLEYTRKEDDTGAIDVAKSDSDRMLESHVENPREEDV